MQHEFEGVSADDITILKEGAPVTAPESSPTGGNATSTEAPAASEGQQESTTTANETSPGTTDDTSDPDTGKAPLDSGTGESDDASTAAAESGNPAPDFDSLLSERSSGKFKNYQELEAHLHQLSQNQKTEQDSLDNDLVAKFKDFRMGRHGGQKEIARLFLETQLMDVDSLEPMDALRTKMKLDHPNRSAGDIDFLLQRKYKLDEAEYDADDIRLSKLQMEDDSIQARKELKEMQQKAALKEDRTNQDVNAQQDRIKEANAKWQKDVDASMQGFETMGLPLNDRGEEFNFGIDNQAEIKGILSDLPGFWNRYVSEDANGHVVEHIDRLRADVTLITNRDQIFKAIYDQGLSAGRDEILKERKNPSLKNHREQIDTPHVTSELAEVAAGLGAQLNKK